MQKWIRRSAVTIGAVIFLIVSGIAGGSAVEASQPVSESGTGQDGAQTPESQEGQREESAVGSQEGQREESAVGSQEGQREESAVGSQEGQRGVSAVGSPEGQREESAPGSQEGQREKSAVGSQEGQRGESAPGSQEEQSQGEQETTAPAENLTKGLSITVPEGKGKKNITDDNIRTFSSFQGGDTILLESDSPICGLYIMWNKVPGRWICRAGDRELFGGEKGFLHEYISLSFPAGKIELEIPEGGAEITDIYAFSPGELPDWVQVWEEPCEHADILLFSTHSDDEQLFFAGILPYYCMEKEAYVQVVYGTHHWDTVTRPHEQLNGLWTVGVRNYPVISEFPDDARSLGKSSESRETVLKRAQKVYDEEAWIAFEVEMLRRFQPQVVIGHDINGEYRHGAHILNTDALMQALPLANDVSYQPESASMYGVWDVPKTYLHLYEENPIVMDWDIPCDSMGGKTAFEMSKQGYACHLSQQNTWFTGWISKEKAADIKKYSPCRYGLYRTTVGEDVAGNDFLENLTAYGETERLLAEEEARLEEERLRAEAQRLEEERQKEEEIRRQAEEERRRMGEIQKETAADGKKGFVLPEWVVPVGTAATVFLILPTVFIILLVRRVKRRKKGKR